MSRFSNQRRMEGSQMMTRFSRTGTLFALLCLALLSACSSNQTSSSSGNSATPAAMGGGNMLTGAGSTFVNPIMSRWIADFAQQNNGQKINYQSVGSGAGIQQLKQGLVDFGASDAALDDQKLAEMPGPVLQIPESAGPVCITYNLPDLKEPLKLSSEALSGIFLGTVKKWPDPVIAKANPGVKLPDTDIVVAHRSDGSGTTNIFTTYLSAVNKDWEKKVGKGTSVQWPVGLGGKGSEGVTGVVKQTTGAIGYVELSYAEENRLPVASICNAGGQFIAPSADSAAAAIDAFKDELANDVRKPIVNPPANAKEAYPISGLTFLLVPKDGKDSQKRQTLAKFLSYVVGDGQNMSKNLHYAPLPPSIVDVDKKLVAGMTVNGQVIEAMK
jgi:phosphate transport system substrate-binding protein